MRRGDARTSGSTRSLAGLLLATTAVAVAMPATAQETQVAQADTNGDIIVTATRRNESLQKVPISIQALGQETLDEKQVTSFDDYAMLPSVSFQSFGPSQSQLFFRGISSGGDGLDAGSLPATGIYLDETPVTTIGGAVDLHIYDIARVEALAGPQGTLFGASSLSGTLRIITNKPDPSKFEAGYDLQLNKFGKGGVGGSGEGFVNIPLSPTIAIRLVGYYDHDGGYIDNTLGQRTFTLGDLDETTNLTVTNADQVKKNFNTVDSYGGRAALKVDLDDNWTVTPSIVYQHQKANGTFLYDPRAGDLNVHDFTKDENLDRWYQAALTIEGKVGNWDLVYSGGYFQRKINNQIDYSYYTVAYDTPGYFYTNFPDGKGGFLNPTQSQIVKYDFTKHTQELRVSSPSENRLRLTTGAFFQRQTNAIDAKYVVPGLGSVPRDDLPNLAPIPGFGDAVYVKRLDRVDRDYAMFGEASFDILPTLTLTAGIRGFIAQNSLYGFSGFNSALANNCVPTTRADLPCVNVNKRISEAGETHKASLSWKIDPERMVYATYSTGFRPGGNNRDPRYGPYKSDTLSNFELGWKTRWGPLRVNGAIFYEKWKDMQFGLARPGDNGVTSISNVGGAEVKGIEGDVLYKTRGLELSASGTYLRAKTTTPFCEQNFSGDIQCTPSGTRLPVQPRFKGNATARYTFATGSAESFVQASVNHQGGTRSFLLDTEAEVVGYTKQFTTLDFSLGTKLTSNMSIEMFIQNAFDQRGQLSRNTACAPSYCGVYYRAYVVKPQLFGIKVGQRFWGPRMHTVAQLKPAMFALHVDGAAVPVETLLDWQSHDRLGVVMTTPLGALGASLAIQLAIACHAAHAGGRRLATSWYAEIYLFHVGGRWGDFSLFDFWPSRRDIFLPGDARAVLPALNSHGITHLLIPDGPVDTVVHDFKEPEAAQDRLKMCFAYSPSGETADADIALSSDDPVTLENMHDTLWPEVLLDQPVDAERSADPVRLADHLRWRAAVRARLDEVAPVDRAEARGRALALLDDGQISETYRRVTTAWALQRLGPA